MYQLVNFSDFNAAFLAMNRADNFSVDGLRALFDYLEATEEETGKCMELDVIALCCDYSQYETMGGISALESFQSDYGDEFTSIDDIREHTTVIEYGCGFIIQAF